MRNDEDIKVVHVEVSGIVEIDLERVEQDPIWDTVARQFNLNDPAQYKQAVEQYIGRFSARRTCFSRPRSRTVRPASLEPA